MCRSKSSKGGGRRCPGKGRSNGSNQAGARGVSSSSGSARVNLGQEQEDITSSGVDGRGDRGSEGSRLVLIGGKQVRIVGTHTPSSARAKTLAERGRPSPTLYELAPEEAGTFKDAITALREGNKYASSVYVYSEEEYADMRLMLTDDGKAGIAIKGGKELVSVFALQGSEHSGCVNSLVEQSVSLGVTHLDCYDTVLPRLYAEEGFLPVARMEWNDDYAPDGWDYETYGRYNGGRPDVVFMKYDPSALDTAYTHLEGTDRGAYTDDYDEGIRLAS